MAKTYGKFWIIFIIIICFFIPQSHLFAQSIHLEWTPSISPLLINYNIYRTTSPDSSFVQIGSVKNSDSLFIDENVQFESHYYYVITALDILGNESGFSNVADTTVHMQVPVKLSGFWIQLNDNDVMLEWTTEIESNNFGFEVQRSGDGIIFTKIGFVKSNSEKLVQRYYKFVDYDLIIGTYYYRLKQIDTDGQCEFSKIISITIDVPNGFYLEQNYPNPFNTSTIITYKIPISCHVTVKVFNSDGQLVANLVDINQPSGSHSIKWDANGNSSGTYFYKIQANDFVSVRRMQLVK